MVAEVNFNKNNTIIEADGQLNSAGDEVQYFYEIENEGDQAINGFELDDTLLGFGFTEPTLDIIAAITAGDLDVAGDDGNLILDVGETWIITEGAGGGVDLTYAITQEDLDSNGLAEFTDGQTNLAGQIDNHALLRGFNGTVQVTDSEESSPAGLTLLPGIDIEKATNGEDADTATGPLIATGDDVTWTYVVTNTGNVALTNVVVVDDQGETLTRGADLIGNNDATLDFGEVWSYTAMGTAGVGQYTNLGTVTADDPADTPVGDEDPSNYFGVDSSIDIEKSTNGDDADSPTGPLIAAGDAVTWEYIVTNTGNVDLDNVLVVDDQGVTVTRGADVIGNDDDILEVGEVWSYTAMGTAEADQYTNLGTVTADDVLDEQVSDEDPSNYFGVDSSIDIEKSTNGEDADTPTGPSLLVGDAVTWEYIVTNTGNVDLDNVLVVDDQGVTVTRGADVIGNDDDILDVGEVWAYTAMGTAEAGQYANLGTVTADDVLDEQVSDEDPSHYFAGIASVDIEKSTNGEDADTPTGPLIAAGDAVTWEYIVTNDGDFDLINVVVVDDQGVTVTRGADVIGNDDDILEVGEVWSYTAMGTAEADQYTNLGTVTADPPAGSPVEDEDPSNYFGVDSSIDIEKSTNGDDADSPTGPLIAAGDAVTWEYIVTNTGNVDLDNVLVVDDQGVTVTRGADVIGNDDDILEVGEVWSYTAMGTAEADQYTNLGTVTADDVLDEQVSDEDPSNYFGVDSSIDIEKATNGEDADTPTGPILNVGDDVTWTYVVTNTGNVDLDNVVVVDDQGVVVTRGADMVGNDDDILDVGEVWSYTAMGIAEEGQYANLGTVTADDVLDEQVSDEDPSHYFGEAPDPGSANTPGFWKNKVVKGSEPPMKVFEQETGLDPETTLYEAIFMVDVEGSKKVSDDPTLQQALSARGGGEAALLRASTAAFANIESDDVNYSFALEKASFSAESLATLEFIDTNDDDAIDFDELKAAVRDAFDEDPGPLEFNDLASALDEANNVLPSVEYGMFMA